MSYYLMNKKKVSGKKVLFEVKLKNLQFKKTDK